MKKRLLITLLVLVGIVLGPYWVETWLMRLIHQESGTIVMTWLRGFQILSLLGLIATLAFFAVPDLVRWIKTGK